MADDNKSQLANRDEKTKHKSSNEESELSADKMFFNPLNLDSTEISCDFCSEVFSVYERYRTNDSRLVQCACCQCGD